MKNLTKLPPNHFLVDIPGDPESVPQAIDRVVEIVTNEPGTEIGKEIGHLLELKRCIFTSLNEDHRFQIYKPMSKTLVQGCIEGIKSISLAHGQFRKDDLKHIYFLAEMATIITNELQNAPLD